MKYKIKDVPNSFIIAAGKDIVTRDKEDLKSVLPQYGGNNNVARDVYWHINELLRLDTEASSLKGQKVKSGKLKNACEIYIENLNEQGLINRLTDIYKKEKQLKERNNIIKIIQNAFYSLVGELVKGYENGNDVICLKRESATYVITAKTFIIVYNDGYRDTIYQEGKDSMLEGKLERLKTHLDSQNNNTASPAVEENRP